MVYGGMPSSGLSKARWMGGKFICLFRHNRRTSMHENSKYNSNFHTKIKNNYCSPYNLQICSSNFPRLKFMVVTRPATVEWEHSQNLILEVGMEHKIGGIKKFLFVALLHLALCLFHNWVNISCRILTWGDGYVDKMVEYRQVGNLSAVPTVSKNQIVPSSCYNKGYPFCPIEAALLRMSSHLYPLGEG